MGNGLRYASEFCRGESGVPNCYECKMNDYTNWSICNIGPEELIERIDKYGENGLMPSTIYQIRGIIQSQIPKPPIILRCNEDIRIGNSIWKAGTSVMKCGSCGEWIVPHWKYCSECGQRIGGSQ